MSVPVDVIMIHAGSVATIPAGWARVAALDGKYIKGTANATNPNTAGGATTHEHASSAHTHTMSAHTHNVVLHDTGNNAQDSSGSGSESFAGDHTHSVNVGGISGGGLSSVASTYAAVSNDPPYYEVIFIAPTGAPADLLDGIISLWNAASAPTGFTFCDGSGTTPDLRNKYPKGAPAATGAGSTGGSTTNTHTLTHTHTETSHSHAETLGGAYHNGRGASLNSGGNNYISQEHTHNFVLNSASAGGINTPSLVTVETVEPAFTKLMMVKNTSGGASQPQTVIGMWLGTLASIPAGWSICDGSGGTPDMRGRFLKFCNTSGELATTGGSNTHTHGSQGHTHSGSSHQHVSGTTDLSHSTGAGSDRPYNGPGGTGWVNKGDISHSSTPDTNDYTAAAWASTNTTGDSSDNQPPFITTAFIMFTGVPTNNTRSAEITGQDSSSDTRAAQITGVDPSEERYAEITGKAADNSERSCEIAGKLVWTVGDKPATPTWTVSEKLTT